MAVGPIDPVATPITYAWSWWRFALATTTAGAVAAGIGWLAGYWLLSAAAGRSVPSPVPQGITFITVYTVCFSLVSLLLARGLPSRLVFRAEGIEMAAPGRDRVLVPYEVVSGVRVRWLWPFVVLEVSVMAAAEPRVARLARGGGRPLRKRAGAEVRFSMPLVGLTAAGAKGRPRLRDALQAMGLGDGRC